MYELISICCGVETVHLTTGSLDEVKRLYRQRRSFAFSRIRISGRILTIREAEKLCGMAEVVNDYMPPKPRRNKGTEKRPARPAPNRKAVERLDESGNVTGRYPSAQAAAEGNYMVADTVRRRCAGSIPNTNGLIFRYAGEAKSERG